MCCTINVFRYISMNIQVSQLHPDLSLQSEIAMNYMKATNFVMVGGLMLAVCVEHSGLHKRIAIRIILALGTSPRCKFYH